MRNSFIRLMSLVFPLGLLLATQTAAALETYTTVIKDHVFQPAEISIPANTRVELKVVNQDTSPEEFESHALHLEKIIPPGATRSLYIGPLKPGEYEFFGEFHPKTAQGRVVVK